MDVPISILYLYIGMAMTIGILGIMLGIKRVAGAPFITIFAGIMIFGLIAIIENIEVGYSEDVNYTLEYPMNVTTGGTTITFSSTITAISERPINTNSLLLDRAISCIYINMFKTGSPTGLATIGILGDNNQITKSFGTIDVTTLLTTSKQRGVCLPNHDYWIISLYDRVGISYSGSTGTDFISVNIDTTNSFDGTNSARSHLTSGTWSDTLTQDVRMILTYDKAEIIAEPILNPFNQEDIWVFSSVLSFFFTYMGVMLHIQSWRK